MNSPASVRRRQSIRSGAKALHSFPTSAQRSCTDLYAESAACSEDERIREFLVTGTVPFHGATPRHVRCGIYERMETLTVDLAESGDYRQRPMLRLSANNLYWISQDRHTAMLDTRSSHRAA